MKYNPDNLPTENMSLSKLFPDYVDCWMDEPDCFTYDPGRNKMIASLMVPAMRLDRIILKTQRELPEMITNKELLGVNGINIKSMDMNDKKQVQDTNENILMTPPRRPRPIFPSDHFGLLVDAVLI